MSKNYNVNAFKGICKMSKVISKIFSILCKVGLGFSLLGIIIVLFINDDAISKISNVSKGGNIGLSFDNLIKINTNFGNITGADLKTIIIDLLIISATFCIVFIPFFKIITNILESVEQNTPFTEKNANGLQRIGLILIIGSFIIKFVKFITVSQIVNIIHLDNIDVNLGMDVNAILIGFLILILSGIFRYGSYLQREFDETV